MSTSIFSSRFWILSPLLVSCSIRATPSADASVVSADASVDAHVYNKQIAIYFEGDSAVGSTEAEAELVRWTKHLPAGLRNDLSSDAASIRITGRASYSGRTRPQSSDDISEKRAEWAGAIIRRELNPKHIVIAPLGAHLSSGMFGNPKEQRVDVRILP